MILVKGERTNTKKCKVRKFDLITPFEPEQIRFVDDTEIPANTLYKMCDEHIEALNKRLERCRLIERAIECAFNRNAVDLLPGNTDPFCIKKKNGHMLYADKDLPCSRNGVFIH